MYKYVIEKQFLLCDRDPQYYNFLSQKFQPQLTKECIFEDEGLAYQNRPKPIQTEGYQLIVKTTIAVANSKNQSTNYRHKEY